MKQYTRIKHDVLIGIFAKGLLSKCEMQVAMVIIRESWGWDHGASNWTKNPLSHQYIAERTGMDRTNVTRVIGRMVAERKLLVTSDHRYAFNEHVDRWIKPEPRPVDPIESVPEMCQNNTITEDQGGGLDGVESTHTDSVKMTPPEQADGIKITPLGVSKQHHQGCQNNTTNGVKITHCHRWEFDVTTLNLKEIRARLKTPKEIFKEIFKETLKEKLLFLREHYETKISKLRTFDQTRERMIELRLETFSLRELMQVVTNISESDWHMGRDPESGGKSYHSWELLFGSDKRVEKYLTWRKRGNSVRGRTEPSGPDRFDRTGFTSIPTPSR